MMSANRVLPFLFGFAMSINFAIFWAVPIMGMGGLWKSFIKQYLLPIITFLDSSTTLRRFAKAYVYTKPEHSDFFLTSALIIINCIISLGTVFYWQLSTGSLPYWLIFAYYCSWVGIGGRTMGGAYALAHKEGHNYSLYKKWIRNNVGHFFENWLGMFFGNTPNNFTTSHVFIHHRLDGGPGDTFYEWDLDRTNLSEFMLYIYRVSKHMVGYSSLKLFAFYKQDTKYDKLYKGVITYWLLAGGILALTRSFSFVFWIYLQPLMCMTYFLALLNYGFHGFLEFDEEGKSIPCVDSTTIIDGDDDCFGEDDHMAHHYNQSVYYKDLAALQESKIQEFIKYKASVFRGLSIVELSIFILFSLWDKLADHYVDYSGKMTREEIKAMLKARAQRRQTNYEDYEAFIADPTPAAREALFPSSKSSKVSSKSEAGEVVGEARRGVRGEEDLSVLSVDPLDKKSKVMNVTGMAEMNKEYDSVSGMKGQSHVTAQTDSTDSLSDSFSSGESDGELGSDDEDIRLKSD